MLVKLLFTSYLSIFSPNAVKYGPEKTPYLDTFHTVVATYKLQMRDKVMDLGRHPVFFKISSNVVVIFFAKLKEVLYS